MGDCAICGKGKGRHRLPTALTPEQQAENDAWHEWSTKLGGGIAFGHPPHLELPRRACSPCFASHPDR